MTYSLGLAAFNLVHTFCFNMLVRDFSRKFQLEIVQYFFKQSTVTFITYPCKMREEQPENNSL